VVVVVVSSLQLYSKEIQHDGCFDGMESIESCCRESLSLFVDRVFRKLSWVFGGCRDIGEAKVIYKMSPRRLYHDVSSRKPCTKTIYTGRTGRTLLFTLPPILYCL
jgi:hypothetical protein